MIHHMHAPVSNMNAFMLAKVIPNESAHNYPSEKSVNEEKFQNEKSQMQFWTILLRIENSCLQINL